MSCSRNSKRGLLATLVAIAILAVAVGELLSLQDRITQKSDPQKQLNPTESRASAVTLRWDSYDEKSTQMQPATSSGLVRLSGEVPVALSRATKLSETSRADDSPLTLTIVLNRTDQPGFDAFLQAVQDPNSPHFRHYLTQPDF